MFTQRRGWLVEYVMSTFRDQLGALVSMKQNPYASPNSETIGSNVPSVRSRIWWFVALALLGVFIGAKFFAGTFGTSPGDPQGTAIPAGIGGFIGLIFGIVMYWLTRPNRQPTADNNEQPNY